MKLPALCTALVLLASLAVGPAPAQPAPTAPAPAAAAAQVASGANLNISPKRVTFDRNHRSATVYIFNQGSAAGTFDISLVDRAMMPDGQILPVAEAQAKPETKSVADRVQSAQPILQIAPRRVSLAPGQGQTVRLRISGAPADTSVSELRSHLTISTLPPRDSGTTAEAAAANAPTNQLSFQINALLGLSIPAIVRLNDLDVRAGLEHPHVSLEKLNGPNGPETPALSIDLVRLGANSLFGNVEVRVQGDPKNPVLGVSRGVGVYTEIDRRAMHIPLTRAPAPGEHLEVTFTDDDTSPGKLLAKLIL
jgi:P pilus assembly chaperone PapD